MENNSLETFWDVRRLAMDATAIYRFLENDYQEFKESQGNGMHGLVGFGSYGGPGGIDLGDLEFYAKCGKDGQPAEDKLKWIHDEFRDYFLRYLNNNIENILCSIADSMMQDVKARAQTANKELKDAQFEIANYYREIELRNI